MKRDQTVTLGEALSIEGVILKNRVRFIQDLVRAPTSS